MMKIQPSELECMTPYEFYLYQEGFVTQQKNEKERIRFQAYVTYASAMAAQGIDPTPFDEWNTNEEESNTDIKDAIEIPADEKLRLEAMMNAIPLK